MPRALGTASIETGSDPAGWHADVGFTPHGGGKRTPLAVTVLGTEVRDLELDVAPIGDPLVASQCSSSEPVVRSAGCEVRIVDPRRSPLLPRHLRQALAKARHEVQARLDVRAQLVPRRRRPVQDRSPTSACSRASAFSWCRNEASRAELRSPWAIRVDFPRSRSVQRRRPFVRPVAVAARMSRNSWRRRCAGPYGAAQHRPAVRRDSDAHDHRAGGVDGMRARGEQPVGAVAHPYGDEPACEDVTRSATKRRAPLVTAR
jgi:hypothetical protein